STVVSQDQLQSQLNALIGRLRTLELDRVGVAARREAIERRIDEVRTAGAKSADADPVIAQLTKLLEIRENQLATVQKLYETGSAVTAAEVQEAQGHVAEAKIEVLKAQRAAGEDASGGILRELNNELSTLIV